MSDSSNPYQSPQSSRFGLESETTNWNNATWEEIRKAMLIRRIIWFALLQGVIIFLFIAMFQGGNNANGNGVGNASPLLNFCRILFPIAILAAVILDWTNFGLGFFRGKPVPNAQKPEVDPVVMGCNIALQSRDIISLAIREGVAFLSIITYQQTRSIEVILYAILLIISMATSFPRLSRVRHCITTILANAK